MLFRSPPAVYRKANIGVLVGKESFFTNVKVLKDPGFFAIAKPEMNRPGEETGESEEDESDVNNGKIDTKALLELVENFKKGDMVGINGFTIKEGKTSPPKRYTSGSMVLAMENAGQLIEDEELRAQIKGAGIGTSATRAGIIEKLVSIHYLNLNKKTQILTPNKLGEMIYEVVYMTIPSMLNPEMTASWEKGLAGVEQGEITVDSYRKTLENYVVKYTDSIKGQNLSDQIKNQIKPFAAGSDYEDAGSDDKHTLEVKCPLCSGKIQTTSFGFGCTNYKQDKSGCNFSIGKIAGKRLSDKEVTELIDTGKVEDVKGFRSKAGKYFSAGLKLEDGAVSFVFPEREEPKESEILCPKCGNKLLRDIWAYTCECGFRINYKIAGVTLTEEQITTLIEEKSLGEMDGFTSKAGKKFRAALKADEEYKISFEFLNRKEGN